jgi:outer membrane protein OmpA-like peptidoglycan-associated protein
MCRLQAEAALIDRATQRLDQARAGCSQGQMQRKRLAAQIEQAETRTRNAQNPSDQKAAEEILSNLKASDEIWLSQEQECQIEQTEAETQFRAEQAKMNDLQAQLDKLDRLLAASVSQ